MQVKTSRSPIERLDDIVIVVLTVGDRPVAQSDKSVSVVTVRAGRQGLRPDHPTNQSHAHCLRSDATVDLGSTQHVGTTRPERVRT